MSPNQIKVQAIAAMPYPGCIKDLQCVMGFCNYYRGYVANYSAIVEPLNKLLRKDAPWTFGTLERAAFDHIKAELCTPGVALQRVDFSKKFTLYTDFSNCGMGAVLEQSNHDGTEPAIVATWSTSGTTAASKVRCWQLSVECGTSASTCSMSPSHSSRTTHHLRGCSAGPTWRAAWRVGS